MNPTVINFLALDRNAELLRQAEHERLRRTATGAGPRGISRPRWRPRIHLRIPRPWVPRPAG